MKSKKTQDLVFLAILSALIIMMNLTGMAYIPIGPLTLTFLTVPVAIGAVVLGPTAGLILGAVFGLSSFFMCFGMNALGTILLGINPILTFITCVIPRILCGWIPGLIYRWMKKSSIAPAIACTSTAVINTILFLLALWLFFGQEFINNPKIIELLSGTVLNGFIAILVAFAGTNAILEAATGLVVGTAATKVILKVRKTE